jgi:hypothetical protein
MSELEKPTSTWARMRSKHALNKVALTALLTSSTPESAYSNGRPAITRCLQAASNTWHVLVGSSQVETVERGILMCLGRHLVPVLTTCSRTRWSYAQRACEVDLGVSSIAKASRLTAHQASQYFNDIRHADVAYTKVLNVCARSRARQAVGARAEARALP